MNFNNVSFEALCALLILAHQHAQHDASRKLLAELRTRVAESEFPEVVYAAPVIGHTV